MTNTTYNNKLEETLLSAYKNNQPLSKETFPEELEKSAAYQIQQEVTTRRITINNEELIGYKISLTSKETQSLFNSNTPLYGALTTSNLSDGKIVLKDMFSPLIEIEVMFLVKEDLSTKDSLDDILAKTSVAPGLEIPDSRFTDWFPKLTLGQIIVDSAVAGKVIIGTPIEGLTFEKLNDVLGTLKFNGKVVEKGSSSQVLEHPVNAVKWLIDELATTGHTIKKGMVISSGTFILPKVLEKGRYEASYEGIGEVSLDVM